MKFVIYEILILFVFNIHIALADTCQNGRNQDLFHNYDLVKLIKKSAEHVHISQSLKSISVEDKDFLKEFEKYLSESFKPEFLMDSFSDVASNKCTEDLKYLYENIRSPGDWALKMLDSYGKPESGILAGNIKWLGAYDECVVRKGAQKMAVDIGKGHVSDESLGSITPGMMMITPYPEILVVLCEHGENAKILWGLQLHCTTFQTDSFSIFEERLESILSNATLTCKVPPKKLTTGAIAVICLLSVFALLALIGSSITALEYYLKAKLSKECERDSSDPGRTVNSTDVENVFQGETDDVTLVGTEEKRVFPAGIEKSKPFFNCFCIFTNGQKILNTASAEGQLPSLHGIRFLSMTWVILGHTYASMSSIVNDSADAIGLIDRWTFQVILNGFFSVDSFFVLSGFLTGYLYFQQAKKTDGKIPWLYFYIHRYIRLTPVYMIVLAFYTTLSPFLGSGPLWPDYDVVVECKNNWWWNILYINNFQSDNLYCMGWSWYLANDMQFYVISPLFLISLWRWPKIGYSLLGLFFSITFACNFVLTYEYDIIAGFGNINLLSKDAANVINRINGAFDKIYYKPYTRIGPYLVGLFLAYYICKRKWNKSPSLNWVTLAVGWIVASGITLTCQFGLYHLDLTTLEACFYNALSRTGFALGLGWVIFVCVIGQGGVVNSILSWKALIPLSRLTYCAYLVHLIVVLTYFTSVRTLTNFSHINAVLLYLGMLVITYGAAVATSLLFESPVMMFLGFLVVTYVAALMTSLLFESPVIRLERLIRNKFAS
ncbi:Nose resistant to fluoxetine protein 6 like protein [Argiope bruennichi]|uniref:Nose resistant to fluoxetine protein 6 like protein n=1 Tax=Argiope bruennichi TaxID=94029 RepID=A0A8T0G1Z6_ARGBR|nr:Nose resistant to fluoxetine protein 6 like protein [Argiope bruennichi]